MTTQSTSIFADLRGKRALVTGASSGIGRAVALELAQAGCDVLVHFAKSSHAAEKVAEQIRAADCRSETISFDLRQTALHAFADEAWNRWGGLEIWINNAGVDVLTGDGARLTYAEKLDQLWQVDVRGTVQLTRLICAKMKSQGHGAIVNIGWDQADRGMEGESGELFAVSKNAIMGFTRSAALNAAPEVRVNCIAPGWVRTAWGEQVGEQWQRRVFAETPLKRWGTPEDIARLARFLVSDEASYLTGQVINANGGAVR